MAFAYGWLAGLGTAVATTVVTVWLMVAAADRSRRPPKREEWKQM